MSTFKARGLVIREIIVGESDKIIILLLKDIGKLSVSAKGARKAKSKFLAGTQLFSYADFVIYDGAKYFSLCEVTLIESFYNLRNDFNKLCFGNLFMEIADKTILSQMPCDEILYLLLISLWKLNKERHSPALVGAAFELKYLQLHGYGAETEYCSGCGGRAGEKTGFFFGSSGALCGICRTRERRFIHISFDTYRAIEYILLSEIKDAFKFRADQAVISELSNAARLMMDSHFEARFKSRELLDSHTLDL